jgi:hypothetical protein
MKKIILILAAALSISAISSFAFAQNETQVPVSSSAPPTMTATQPVNPVPSKPGGPVIQSITAQIPTRGSVTANVIIPEFHFFAPNGNAVLIHRELVATSANNVHVNPSTAINIPEDAQKSGAVVGGGWNCNTNPYYVTLRAWIMDGDGIKSNEVQYTVHCNGG